MRFREKKEYYSLRKFKGVGLASALIGAMLLSPSVLAEEVQTGNQKAQIAEKSSIEDVSKVNKDVKPNQEKVEIVSQSQEVSKQKTEEHSKTVYNEVDSPKASSEENSQEISKIDENAEHSKDSKTSERTEDKPKSRKRRDTSSQESEFVSDKAKEVVHELNDTLVMKKEDTASTSSTLSKFDEGVKPTEEEKVYVKAIKDSFDDLPELVRSSVNSLTFVRKPNGTYAYTYSKSGDVNMNMQYYHPELTGNEEGSLNQSVAVLGHEVGHIFNAKSFRDGDTWSFSRDPKYSELSKEVYNRNDDSFLISRWASDFGSYLGWISGKGSPRNDGERKIFSYMDSLFKGILTPREDRITSDLKSAVDIAKSSGKKLVYDGHVSLDATYKDVEAVQSHVDDLNRKEIAKVSSISDKGHFKTYGINKLITTRYTVDGVDLIESVLSKEDAGQQSRAGYSFLNKEVSHDGLLVEYKYRESVENDLSNDKISAGLSLEEDPVKGKLEDSSQNDLNRGNLHFEMKTDAENLRIKYRLYDVTTGRYQHLVNNQYNLIASQTLNGRVKDIRNDVHTVGRVQKGYVANTDIQYRLMNGSSGDNVYRLEVSFYDGDNLLGTVYKDVKTKVISYDQSSISNVKDVAQIKDEDRIIGGIVKDDRLYTASFGKILERSPEMKQFIKDLQEKYRQKYHRNDWTKMLYNEDQALKITILNPDYKLVSNGKNIQDKPTNHDNSDGREFLLPITDLLSDDRRLSFEDSRILLEYKGSNKLARVDKVPFKVEIISRNGKVVNSDGSDSTKSDTVLWSRTFENDVHFVNYEEKYSKYFSNDFISETKTNLDGTNRANEGFDLRKEDDFYKNSLARRRVAWSNLSSTLIQEQNYESTRVELQDSQSDQNVLIRTGVHLSPKLTDEQLFNSGSYKVTINRPTNTQFNYDLEKVYLLSVMNDPSHNLDKADFQTQRIYSVKSDGRRELIQSIKPSEGIRYSHTVQLPNDTQSIEIEVEGQFNNEYRPMFQATWITDRKVKDLPFRENSDYSSAENDDRSFKHNTVIATNGGSRTLQDATAAVLNRIIMLDNERDSYGYMHFRSNVGNKFRLQDNDSNLKHDGEKPVEFDSTFNNQRWLLLPEGIEPVSKDYSSNLQKVMIDGVEYTLWTQNVTVKDNYDYKSISSEMIVKPTALKGVRESKLYGYSGYYYRLKDGVDSRYYENDMLELKQNDVHDAVARLLGASDVASIDRNNGRIDTSTKTQMPNGRFDVVVSAAQEAYSDHSAKVISGDGSLNSLRDNSVLITTSVSNFRNKSIRDNVIYQTLPKGNVSASFDGVESNPN